MFKYSVRFIKPNCRTFIDGFGRVPVGNNTEKLVKNIKQGDKVLTPYGIDTVKSITKYFPETALVNMSEFNKMLITPEHPIKIYDEWVLPTEVKESDVCICSTLYRIHLEKYDTITVNGNNIKA